MPDQHNSKAKTLIISLIIISSVCAAGFFYYQNTSAKSETTKRNTTYLGQETTNDFNTIPTADAAKKVTDTNELKLTIASPKNEITISANDTLKVAGATKKGASIIIINQNDPYTGKVNEDGSFAPTIQISEGLNTLKIMASTFNSEVKSAQRQVLYFKDAIDYSEAQVSTGILDTDKSDNEQVTLKLADETNQSIQINKQTKIYSLINEKKKSIKLSDLDSELPLYVIHNQSALLVFQQNSDLQAHQYSFGEVIDKAASLGGTFEFTIQEKHAQRNQLKISVTNETILNNETKESNLSPSDIKLGDKVAVAFLTLEDTNQATHLYTQHGQAAGILKDLRDNPSSTPTSSATGSPIASPKE